MGTRLRLTSGEVLAGDVAWARRPLQRARGLIGRPRPASGSCLVLEPATQVHTFGMRYPIDALFCDEDWVVLHIVRAMAPWRLSRWVRGSRFVVEFAGGTLGRRVSPGARLVLERDPASAS